MHVLYEYAFFVIHEVAILQKALSIKDLDTDLNNCLNGEISNSCLDIY